jgi:ElaB/YqjD/DUF883 family membrane-anchored ribosome-binding protein
VGEDPGTAGAPVAGKDPEQIREEIEDTRRELGDTVEALAAKADVKAQVRERIAHTKEAAAEKLGQAREASPDGVSSAASQASQKAKENPIPATAIGAFVAGFVLGRITKRS